MVMGRIAVTAATTVRAALDGEPAPAGLIIPHVGDVGDGVTNKISFLAPERAGPDIARAAVAAVTREWSTLVQEVFGASEPTPGFPDIAWVSVTGDETDSAGLWQRTVSAMEQRRRSRVFEPLTATRVDLCSLDARLPAAPRRPTRTPEHEANERLSVANWVKRRIGSRENERFPSTSAIASAAYRARLLAAAASEPEFARELTGPVAELARVVAELGEPRHRGLPGVGPVPVGLTAVSDRLGTWIIQDPWKAKSLAEQFDLTDPEDTAQRGRDQARLINRLARKRDITRPTPYYALIVQDLDHLGRKLATMDIHLLREASAALSTLGREQREVCAEHLGVPVYAGGDDLLVLAPAANALTLAAALRQRIDLSLTGTPLAGATASTAVVFSHHAGALSESVQAAQTALTGAKDAVGPGNSTRDALSIVVNRRGGERIRTVQPWRINGVPATDVLRSVIPAPGWGELSAGLAAELERDAHELDALSQRYEFALRDEVIRLVKRHHGTAEVAEALCLLGRHERVDNAGRRFQPVPAALVGRFLNQECV